MRIRREKAVEQFVDHKELHDKIKRTIEQLRVYIQDDGGDMELIDVDHVNKTVSLKISGACVDCDIFDQTFHHNVKQTILKTHPELKDVKFIKHHKKELIEQ
jgi:Fe-S cluster biogenesis protein NfuA